MGWWMGVVGGGVWWVEGCGAAPLVGGCVGPMIHILLNGHSVSSGILLSSILFRIELSSLLILPNFC